jgi:hypothetical protein
MEKYQILKKLNRIAIATILSYIGYFGPYPPNFKKLCQKYDVRAYFSLLSKDTI